MRPKYVPVKTVFSTAGRTADGSFPVEGTIPVADGTVLQITVYRQNGTEENWTLTVQTDTAAEARAGDQTDRQPAGRGGSDAGRCRCSKNGQNSV